MAEKPLTSDEKAAAKEIFEALDQDGDGAIDHDDMKKALANAGYRMEDEEIDAVLKRADPDGKGVVSFDEYMDIVEKRPLKKRIEAALRKLFEMLDADGSGYITKTDLKKIVKEAGYADDVTDDQIEELVDQLDAGGDGKVSFDDFMSAFIA